MLSLIAAWNGRKCGASDESGGIAFWKLNCDYPKLSFHDKLQLLFSFNVFQSFPSPLKPLVVQISTFSVHMFLF